MRETGKEASPGSRGGSFQSGTSRSESPIRQPVWQESQSFGGCFAHFGPNRETGGALKLAVGDFGDASTDDPLDGGTEASSLSSGKEHELDGYQR
jgi:hypothetical protein